MDDPALQLLLLVVLIALIWWAVRKTPAKRQAAPAISAPRIESKTEFAGTGALIQGIGLLLLFFFPIGTVVGIALLIVGSQKSRYYVCVNCGNRLADKEVKMCPVCKAALHV